MTEPDGAPQDGVSKSQRKRDARALFDLGKRLAELPDATVAALPLEPDVLEAVRFARSIRSNVARKRQLGYLAGLLRRADVEPVLEALEREHHAARELNARHHRCEAWRDHLLEGGDEALGALLDQRPEADAQALRQLIRNARREAEREQPPAAARKLFRRLREIDEAAPLPPI